MQKHAHFCVLLLCLHTIYCTDWSPAEKILKDAIIQRAFPGCSAVVANKDGPLYTALLGRQTYDQTSSSITLDTLWDMASLTKVLITTTAVAQLYERGVLPLDTTISSIFPEFAAAGKATITVSHLLLHNSGFPADPSPGYGAQAFGCPQAQKYHPAQDFSCMDRIFDGLMNQKLKNPVGQVYVYSDLSMITLMFVVGKIAKDKGYVNDEDVRSSCPLGQKGSHQCYYEAYANKYIFSVSMRNSMFIPPLEFKYRCSPAWNESTYFRHELVWGYVSDSNAYALGGIAGHAGLFATIKDTFNLISDLLFEHKLLNETTIKLFTTVKNVTQSSRAFGWDTNAYQSEGSMCQAYSKDTFAHTGFTGTGICADKERGLMSILLTNRVYPDKSSSLISGVRNAFNKAVKDIYDKHTQ
jgi:CubicO group peptidase (beta-lactamase class C family)